MTGELLNQDRWHDAALPQARLMTPFKASDLDLVAASGATRLLIEPNRGEGGLEFFADGWAELGIESVHFGGQSYWLEDLTPLLVLRGSLRKLTGLAFHRMNIDLAAFPRLEWLGIDWAKGAESVFDCTGLTFLWLSRCPDEDLSRLHRLKDLEQLVIVSRKLRRITGISALHRLWAVSLYYCPKLENTQESLGELRQLPHLTYLDIAACKGITDLETVSTSPTLQKLDVVNDRRTLRSLQPLRHHPALRDACWLGTKIEDGDMTPLLDIPTLERAVYQNYRHYTHTSEELCAILDVRNGNPSGQWPVIARPASLDE